MPDLTDLFPGYASEWITTKSGRIFARVGGKGPPLLLLHGFSETHVMWHRVAPQLADRFTLIIADLPGYGWSDMPESDADHTPYTKRAMAQAMVEAMERLGHMHFALAGHGRRRRGAYGFAPGRSRSGHEDHDPDAGIMGRRRRRARCGNAARHLEEMGDQCLRRADRFRTFSHRGKSGRDGGGAAGFFRGWVTL